MDLVQTLKLFVQQHLECIGLVRSRKTPQYALNTRGNKDFELVEGEIGCLCWTICWTVKQLFDAMCMFLLDVPHPLVKLVKTVEQITN